MREDAKVFVVQDLGFDYSDAETFGELVYLVERKEVSAFNTARARALIQRRLWNADFQDGDFILAVGSPAMLMMAGIEAGKLAKEFNVLQWDRNQKQYYSIELRS